MYCHTIKSCGSRHGLGVTDLENHGMHHAFNSFTTMDRFCEKFFWQSPSYDALNRLLSSVSVPMTSGYPTSSSNRENFTYDKQGNIKTLTRQSGTTSVDNLVMTYSGNQVKSITDASGSQGLYNVKEYQNKANTTNEMSYDKNGNMTKDLDRDIVTIRYNILNLPDTIQFKYGNQIINRYAADGSKLYSNEYYKSKS